MAEKRGDIPGKGNASSFGVQQQSYNVVVKMGLQSAASGGRWPAGDYPPDLPAALPAGRKLLRVLLEIRGQLIGIGHCVQGFAVFERGNGHEGFEHPFEVGQAFITQLMGNPGDAHICFLQQALGPAYAVYVGVLRDRVSRNLLKGAA